MKKIIIFFLMILSINIFSEEYKPYLKENTDNKNLVFSAQIEDSKKTISIYRENEKLIYVYGLEGKKPEKTIIGIVNKNLFKNDNEVEILINNNDTIIGKENFVLFKVKNHTYIISFYNNNGAMKNSYYLSVARNEEEILFGKNLDISTIYDALFNTNIFEKLPYDNGVVGYYITYD